MTSPRDSFHGLRDASASFGRPQRYHNPSGRERTRPRLVHPPYISRSNPNLTEKYGKAQEFNTNVLFPCSHTTRTALTHAITQTLLHKRSV